MSAIPDSTVRTIAERLEKRADVPDGLPSFDWRFTEDRGSRVRMSEQEGAPIHHRADDAVTAVLDFDEGPVVRFTHSGVEYEAAWDQAHRVVAYRAISGGADTA